MSIAKRKSQIPHVKWIDLKDDGVLYECAVFKEDDFGNTYYLEIAHLDAIDKSRLSRILYSRNAETFELWDLMSQVTLNNGMNALDYFHQLVKVISDRGVIMNPRLGSVGTGSVNTANESEMKSMELNNVVVESVAKTSASKAKVPKKGAED